VDTLVEMDRPIFVLVVVVAGHSISIQMEQKRLDGSTMENAKLNLWMIIYKNIILLNITLAAKNPNVVLLFLPFCVFCRTFLVKFYSTVYF